MTGADRHDEVWQGVRHMVAARGAAHSLIVAQLAILLDGPARVAGLVVSVEFNLGDAADYRVPDLGVHRGTPCGTWLPTAAVAVEVLSPNDETWDKLEFYAGRGVEELLIVDPVNRSVDWRSLRAGEYVTTERSALLDLPGDELAGRIDWPAIDE